MPIKSVKRPINSQYWTYVSSQCEEPRGTREVETESNHGVSFTPTPTISHPT